MNIDFDKQGGLVPAVIQDANTKMVLMLGYMNKEAVAKTKKLGKVTFFSRSKQRLWTKGEESGHVLKLVNMKVDCDQDTILVQAIPHGPTCHTGQTSCFGEQGNLSFLHKLETIIHQRAEEGNEESYTVQLLARGMNKVAQKVGEEAVELVIEAKDDDRSLFLNEAADLMYHYLVLLKAKGLSLNDVEEMLSERHK